MPEFAYPYNADKDKRKSLMRLFQQIRVRMMMKQHPSKIHFQADTDESLFAWISPGFELFVAFGPLVTKQNVVTLVNALLRRIREEEDVLFVIDAPTFA